MSILPTETSPLLRTEEPPADHAASAPSDAEPEPEPITTRPEPRRIHWLDNLRTFLTIILIFLHATLETVRARSPREYAKTDIVPLTLLAAINRSVLWNLFFFVSGHSASLALLSCDSSKDWVFFGSRMLKVVLPAMVYKGIGQLVLFFSLALRWEDIFGSYKALWGFVRLAGPVAYVAVLVLFDWTYLLIRFVRRRRRRVSSSSSSIPLGCSHGIVEGLLSSPLVICTSIIFVFLISTFFGCLSYHLPFQPIYFLLPYDIPWPGAPLSLVIAYIAGVRFRFMKHRITIRPISACIAFFVAFVLAAASMGVAQELSPPLWDFIDIGVTFGPGPWFIDGGFNPHTIFFTLWTTFLFFVLSPLLIVIFSQTKWLNRDFGFGTRHTYLQTYINMIPILVAIFYLRGLYDLNAKTFLVGLIAVIVSWMVVIVPGILGRFVIIL